MLKNFVKFTGKQIYLVFFFDEVAGLQAATLLKNRLPYRCSCEVCKIFRKICFTQHLQTTASAETKISFKTEERSHQEMLYVICDLPISDVSCEITWQFTKILERNQWRSCRPTTCNFNKILLNFEKQPL